MGEVSWLTVVLLCCAAVRLSCRALDWERKSLAAGLKWNLTEPEREELYRGWGVDPDTKERKLQLVFKLWSKEILQ